MSDSDLALRLLGQVDGATATADLGAIQMIS